MMRVAHAVGLMPALAESMELFTATFARALRERTDVGPIDVDAAAFVLTSTLMGIVHTLVWNEMPSVEVARIRASLVELAVAYLSPGVSAGASAGR